MCLLAIRLCSLEKCLELLCPGGNGHPLQCSCLENPRDGGAWWAAVYGVAQSRTWLKRLSSSSSSPFLNWAVHFLVESYDCIFRILTPDQMWLNKCFLPFHGWSFHSRASFEAVFNFDEVQFNIFPLLLVLWVSHLRNHYWIQGLFTSMFSYKSCIALDLVFSFMIHSELIFYRV